MPTLEWPNTSPRFKINFQDIYKIFRNLAIWSVPWLIVQMQQLNYGEPINIKAFIYWVAISTLIEILRRFGSDYSTPTI